MDFNNIQTRIERVYSSIHERLDKNIDNYVERVITKDKIGVFFNSTNNESKTLNKIFTIVHNIANLKDNLKTIMSSNGKDERLIEQEIDNSFHLQLIMDLSNQDKHGYPLTRKNRSGKNPQIQNIRAPLKVTTNEKGKTCIRMNPFWNNPVQVVSGNTVVEICADITDQQGNKLMTLNELVDKAILAWEKVIKNYNLV